MAGRRVTVWVCLALLVGHVLVGWSALQTKSSTFDEPLHALAGWSYLKTGDLRVNPEHPPVWKYWAGLVQRAPLTVDWEGPAYRMALSNPDGQWNWAVQTLYRTRGNDGEAFVRSARNGMWVIDFLLGVVIACWGWRAGGAAGGIAACGLFAVDANFLAHGGLVTNDVAVALAFAVAGWLLWEMRERVRWGLVVVLGVVCGVGACTKFSGVVLGPVVVGVMGWYGVGALFRPKRPDPSRLNEPAERASGAQDDNARGGDGEDSAAPCRPLGGRSLSYWAAIVVVGMIAWAVIWACYGFRFGPGREGELLDTAVMARRVGERRWMAWHDGQMPSAEEVKGVAPDGVTRGVLWAEGHRLLPQGWLYGLLMSHATTVYNPAFLLGEIRGTGWWDYFPVAMGVKTATGTIVLVAVALMLLAVKGRAVPAAVFLPVVVFMAFAMSSAFNVGVRHVLPVYPFIYVLIGYAVSGAWSWRAVRWVVGALGAGAAVEVLLAWPNYIAFFNVAGRELGPIHVLGDSNLDWGQDLPLLAKWQAGHAKETLFLAYFGTADPEAYGIKYWNLPGGYDAGPPQAWPSGRGTVAVSATVLQGIYGGPRLRERYGRLKQFQVREVLGGSIYLYDYPFKKKGK